MGIAEAVGTKRSTSNMRDRLRYGIGWDNRPEVKGGDTDGNQDRTRRLQTDD